MSANPLRIADRRVCEIDPAGHAGHHRAVGEDERERRVVGDEA